MEIPEDTLVGHLKKEDESRAEEMRMGRTASIGPIRATPVWQQGAGLILLAMMKIHSEGIVVAKSEERQAGAFLLEPEESFSLGCAESDEGTYAFKALPVIEIAVDQSNAALCGFCRSPLKERAMTCLSPTVRPLKGKALCEACARAWVKTPETPTCTLAEARS